MATSGTVTFNESRDDIIKAALRKCGVLARGVTPTLAEINDASDDLNRMIKMWEADGIHLWSYAEMSVFPVVNQAAYTVGPTGSKIAIGPEVAYIQTTLTAGNAIGDTALTVTSIADIANGDHLGIALDNGTVQWTTVNGAPSGTTVTTTATLTGTALAGAYVYAYTNQTVRPLQVHAGRIKIDNAQETPMRMISKEEYDRLPNKNAPGKPTQFHYDPLLTNGVLYLWPVPDSVQDVSNFTVSLPIEDFNASTDNPALPQEWLLPIVWNLAKEIGPEYGLEEATMERIEARAAESKQYVMGWDQEEGFVSFQPTVY